MAADLIPGEAPPAAPGNKHCVVAYATAHCQSLWPVELAAEATIADAIQAARAIAALADVPWDTAETGIFGELRARTFQPQDGDRIELYRPLQADPREQRRARVQQQRKSTRSR